MLALDLIWFWFLFCISIDYVEKWDVDAFVLDVRE